MLSLNYIFSFVPSFLILHCLFIVLFRKWLGPIGTFYSACLSFGLVILLNINELFLALSTGTYYYIDFGRWFFCLDLIDSHLVFCVDSLALIASILVLTLTIFALYFGVEYMYREAFINRLLYLLNLFATSVVFLFFCYDYFLIMFAWECIGLFSFLLVNFYSTRIYTIKAALKTFVFSRISDMFMFISFTLSLIVFNTTDLSLIFIQTPFLMFHYIFVGKVSIHFLTFFSLTLALSGGIKAAQFFSHVWLPDAMEAPTPASALIHSSTLVVAGVFLIIRFSVVFEFTLFTNYLLALLGAMTLAFGSVTATFQQDIKKLVAYSTISQIGYLVCGCGFCCYEEVLLYLIIHALNKAFLFVLVGYTVHFFAGNTDLRQMGGMYIYSFDLTVLFVGVCVNLAGMPYSAGFVGKELLLFQVLREDFLSLIVRGCWMVSFLFTPIYMLMLIFLVLFGPKKGNLHVYLSYWSIKFKDYVFIAKNLKNNSPRLETLTRNKTQTLDFKLKWSDRLELVQKNLTTTKFLIFYWNNEYRATIRRVSETFISAIRFQFTIVTSRLTVYVLFVFWLFFFFFGNSLLAVLLNFTTLTDTIFSSSFTTLKGHAVFSLNSTNSWLSNSIFFYIQVATILATFFLINLRFTFTYNYYFIVYLFDLVLLFLLVFTWYYSWVWIC